MTKALIVFFIFDTVVVGLVLWFVFRARRRRIETLSRTAEQLKAHAVKPGQSYRVTIDGVEAEYRYHPGSKNNPSSLKISIHSSSQGHFEIGQETAWDRFGKKLGMALEIQTGDPGFDDKIYIKSNNPYFAHAYFGEAQNREAVKALMQEGFKVKYTGQQMEALKSPYQFFGSISPELIRQIAEQLLILNRNVNSSGAGPTMMGTPLWKLRRNIVLSITALAILAAIGGLISGMIWFQPVNSMKVFLFSIKYSLFALAFFIAWAILWLAGRSNSHNEILGVILSCVMAFPLAGWGGAMVINGWKDPASPEIHRVMVMNKTYTKNKDSKTYYLHVEYWRSGPRIKKLTVPYQMYQSARPGVSKLMVITKGGRLNFEWITAKSLE